MKRLPKPYRRILIHLSWLVALAVAAGAGWKP